MKNLFLFTTLLFITSACFSQDLISLKKGNRIEVIVTEITPTLIRYKLFTDPKGRTYFVYKDDVTGIMYQDGRIETFDQPGEHMIESKPVENRRRENSRTINRSNNNRNQTNDITSSDDRNNRPSTQRSTPRNNRPSIQRPTRSSGLQSGYKGIIEWGYYFGVGDYVYDRANFSFINGYQVNPYFSFGVGTGIHYYLDSEQILILYLFKFSE